MDHWTTDQAFNWVHQFFIDHTIKITLAVNDTDPDYTMLKLIYGNIKGIITVWDNGIIEEEIATVDTNDLIYYLHFLLEDDEHFKRSIKRFNHIFCRKVDERPYTIAICGDSSSSLFTALANEFVELTNLNLNFITISLTELSDNCDIDFLYLIPQLAPYQETIMSLADGIPIDVITPLIYGSYNVSQLITVCLDQLEQL